MSTPGHKIPAYDPRAIYSAAEDFRISELMMRRSRDRATDEEACRMICPQMVLAAFATELYLKCLIADEGSQTIPAKHDLDIVFQNLPQQCRAKIAKEWRQMMKHNDAGNSPAMEIADVIQQHAKVFEKWRYRYEHHRESIKSDAGMLPVLAGFLRWFILKRHPEWEDDESFFLSTFPSL